MKALIRAAFLTVLLSLFSAPAVGQVGAEWLLADVWTGVGTELRDGTRINLRYTDVSDMNVYVQFSWDSPNLITEYIDRIEWSVQHTGLDFPVEFVTNGSADGFSWPLCNSITEGSQSPIGCSMLKKEGSVTVTARAIYDDHGSPPVIALVAEDSRAFRIYDSTPVVRERPRRGPSVPFCSGNQVVCDETVGNDSLWKALTGLCESRPGEKLWLGRKGAFIQCP